MKILHLYYDLMNLYGEYGNVVVLKRHLEDQGLSVELTRLSLFDEIDFRDYDFIYCGCGSEKNLMVALKDLKKREGNFKEAIEKGSVILFTGNSMEMFGRDIDGVEALSLADFSTKITDSRFVGDVVMQNEQFGQVVGFINRASKCSEHNDYLFKYLFKDNNVWDGEYEGFVGGNVFGSHVIGPILVKNPNFMEYIVTLLGKKENSDFKYQKISYPLQEDSYRVTLNALMNRK